MRVIGLTGGIGAGKSTVSAYLRDHGYRILDADQMARALTEPGSPVLDRLAERFGTEILLPDGSLDRRRLGALVFADAAAKADLEALTTRTVIRQLTEILQSLRDVGEPGLVFVDAPLLFETGADRLTDLVWLVDADPEVRLRRVMERDHLTREEVLARMAGQMDDEEKRRRAREHIDNTGGKAALYRQVARLLQVYDQRP